MKKILLMIVFILMLSLSACQMATEFQEEGTGDHQTTLSESLSPVRKIIYKVEMKMNVSNLETAIAALRAILESDEWFDYENIQTSIATFKVRVKTERLDAFVAAIKGTRTLSSYSKVGTDVSLQYQSAADKILNYQAQYARLLELYENASLSDMIVINQQLSLLEINIAKEQGILNQFDSLADYSEVSITLYASALQTQSPFINRLGGAFVSGFEGLLWFFDRLLIAIATILPFVIVFVPTGFGIYFLAKYLNRRPQQTKKSNQTIPPKDNPKTNL